MASTFGDYVRQRRLDLDLGLREFADRIGVEASNYSKIERGLKRAPTGERLLPYVEALGLEPEAEHHRHLDALAHVANGEIPSQVLTDERLASKLPLLFGAAARGLTDEQVDEIVRIVAWAHTPEPVEAPATA